MNVLSIPTIAAMLVFWILGLYVLTRSPRTETARLAAACQLLIALYLLGQSVASNATNPEDYRFWSRTFWFGAALAPPAWYWLALRLALPTGDESRVSTLVGVALAALGVISLIAGMTDNLLLGRDTPTAIITAFGFTQFGSSPGPLYWIYATNVVGSAVASCVVLIRARSRQEAPSLRRAQLVWMLRSGVVFAVGAGYLVANETLDPGLPEQLGYLLLTIGLTLVGYGIARYNALVEGQVIAADFVDFVGSSLGLVVIYAAVVVLMTGVSRASLPLLLVVVLVAIASHALANVAQGVWDRVFHRPDVRLLRGELRTLEGVVARTRATVDVLVEAHQALDRVTDTRFRALVEDALRKLNNVAALAEHPLQDSIPELLRSYLTPVPADPMAPNRSAALDRARALRQALSDGIQRLRPPGEQTSKFDPAWAHYLILHEAYEIGRQNKEIMRSHQLSEGTFNRYRRQAVAALATDLRERGGVPTTHDKVVDRISQTPGEAVDLNSRPS